MSYCFILKHSWWQITAALFVVCKDTNKRAKIQILFEIFQAEVSSTLVKYTKILNTPKQIKRKKSRNATKNDKYPGKESIFSEAFGM